MKNTLPSNIEPEYQDLYERDGVVLIKQAFDREWIEYLLQAWNRLQTLEPNGIYQLPNDLLEQDPRLRQEMDLNRSNNVEQRKRHTEFAPGFIRTKYMRWWMPEFDIFIKESPAAELVGRVIGSKTIRFFVDAIFMKEPKCDARTYWHSDAPSWPVHGNHVPTMWMPLHPVSAELSSLEYVAGSHKMDLGETPWPETFNSESLEQPSDRPSYYDWEARRDDPTVRFVSYDMEPGDVVILHPETYHGGGANLHPSLPRIAISTRWLGDDVVWDPQPEAVNIPGLPLDKMQPGQPVTEDEIFPILWQSA